MEFQPPLPSPSSPASILIPEVTPCISPPPPSLKTGTVAPIFPEVRLNLGRIMDLKNQLLGEAPCTGLCLLSLVQAQGCVGCTLGRLASSHCRLCNLLWSPLSAGNPGPGCQLQPSGSTSHYTTWLFILAPEPVQNPSLLSQTPAASISPPILLSASGTHSSADGACENGGRQRIRLPGSKDKERTRPLFLSKAKPSPSREGKRVTPPLPVEEGWGWRWSRDMLPRTAKKVTQDATSSGSQVPPCLSTQQIFIPM